MGPAGRRRDLRRHLNDINGFHVTAGDTIRALDSASPGRCAEGRRRGHGHGVPPVQGRHRHGLAGARSRPRGLHRGRAGAVQLRAAGESPHGRGPRRRGDLRPDALQPTTSVVAGTDGLPPCDGSRPVRDDRDEAGSIIVVVATDAPLLPHQLKRVVKRVALGVGRMGGFGGNRSGDIFVAFSTANAGRPAALREAGRDAAERGHAAVPGDGPGHRRGDPQRAARGRDDDRINDLRVFGMPVDRVVAAMKKYRPAAMITVAGASPSP